MYHCIDTSCIHRRIGCKVVAQDAVRLRWAFRARDGRRARFSAVHPAGWVRWFVLNVLTFAPLLAVSLCGGVLDAVARVDLLSSWIRKISSERR